MISSAGAGEKLGLRRNLEENCNWETINGFPKPRNHKQFQHHTDGHLYVCFHLFLERGSLRERDVKSETPPPLTLEYRIIKNIADSGVQKCPNPRFLEKVFINASQTRGVLVEICKNVKLFEKNLISSSFFLGSDAKGSQGVPKGSQGGQRSGHFKRDQFFPPL